MRTVVLTDRDKILFQALFEHRVLDLHQIKNVFFTATSVKTVGKRLAALFEAGYLRKESIVRNSKAAMVYFAQKKAVEILSQTYPFQIAVKHDIATHSVLHDLELFNIRERLSDLPSVERYYTENMLQSCSALKGSLIFGAFTDLNSDAAIELKTPSGSQFGAIEYEDVRKTRSRYRSKLVNYYSRAEIDFVIYICTTKGLVTLLSDLDKEFSYNSRPKLFFALLEEFKNRNQKITFFNHENHELVLK